MSDVLNIEEQADDIVNALDELTILKQRARLMGIAYSNNIGLPALKLKIEAKQAEASDEPEEQEVDNPLTGELAGAPKMTIRELMQKEEMKLIRLRITCLDPKKKELPGEIFTVANEFLGTVKKFIPFGEVTDNGYHVPYCLYQMLASRKFLNIRVIKSSGGKERVEHNWVKEFALEILPPLTKIEMDRLAAAQAAAGTFETVNA